MTEASYATSRSGASRPQRSTAGPTGWQQWISFASTMMILTGLFQIVQGSVAVVNEEFLRVRSGGLLVDVGWTPWGWTWLLLGFLVIAAAVGVLLGQLWARVVGVVLAGVSLLLNFAFLATYPVWSLVVIVVDVFIIFALTVHGAVDEQRS
jgi:hypothetical protein